VQHDMQGLDMRPEPVSDHKRSVQRLETALTTVNRNQNDFYTHTRTLSLFRRYRSTTLASVLPKRFRTMRRNRLFENPLETLS
jgi:hypothetical protein